MTIIVDARADRHSLYQGFRTIQAYNGDIVYYNTSVAAQTNYFGSMLGLPRRFGFVPNPIAAGIMYRFCEPKIGQPSPRSEAGFLYETIANTRWFLYEFMLPASGPDYWTADSLASPSYTVCGQWHEFYQPPGARPPPIEMNIYEDVTGVRLRCVTSTNAGIVIDTITHSGNLATVTTHAPHNLTSSTGTIFGASPSAYNGTFTLTVTGASTFTYVMGSTPATDAIPFVDHGDHSTTIAGGIYFQTTYECGVITRGTLYRVVIQSKAAGATDDILNMWLNGVQKATRAAPVGYSEASQNFFKIGTYSYPANASPWAARILYYKGFLMGDASESYSSMNTTYDTAVPTFSRVTYRYSVGLIGGTNALGADTSTVLNRSVRGGTCIDPVSPAQLGGTVIAATTPSGSVVPAIQNGLCAAGYSANVFNCAAAGMGLTSYSGQCKGQYATGTAYLPGDSVTPASTTGQTTLLPLGLKYICLVGGQSDVSPPTWPTAENATVTDNGITWSAERREAYDIAGHTYTAGEMGFDPMGLSSQALGSVRQQSNVDKYVILAAPQLDSAQNTSIAAAVTSLTSYFASAGVSFVTSAQSASGTLLTDDMPAIGAAMALEVMSMA